MKFTLVSMPLALAVLCAGCGGKSTDTPTGVFESPGIAVVELVELLPDHDVDLMENLLGVRRRGDEGSDVEKQAALMGRIKDLHPYEVPEIVAVVADAAGPEYLAWARSSLE